VRAIQRVAAIAAQTHRPGSNYRLYRHINHVLLPLFSAGSGNQIGCAEIIRPLFPVRNGVLAQNFKKYNPNNAVKFAILA
jgi:hypothetical protein